MKVIINELYEEKFWLGGVALIFTGAIFSLAMLVYILIKAIL